MPAALQRKKDSSKYFNMSAEPFYAVPCIHTIFRPFATIFVEYAG